MNKRELEKEVVLMHERICSALGDPTRILILYLLNEKDACVNEISASLDLPQSSASRHLRILRERNLVSTIREGTLIRYSLKDKRIIQALELMRSILASQLKADVQMANSIQSTSIRSK
jgi:DNA-binding transcriptional ArsR family regulator